MNPSQNTSTFLAVETHVGMRHSLPQDSTFYLDSQTLDRRSSLRTGSDRNSQNWVIDSDLSGSVIIHDDVDEYA